MSQMDMTHLGASIRRFRDSSTEAQFSTVAGIAIWAAFGALATAIFVSSFLSDTAAVVAAAVLGGVVGSGVSFLLRLVR